MSRWIARFAFTCIALACVFAYEGYRNYRGDYGAGRQPRAYAYFATAFVCFGLGLCGMRERHRPQEPRDIDERRE